MSLVPVVLACAAADAAERVVVLDPAATTIGFTLGATLHTVHGTVALDRGELRLDPETHALSGEIVMDTISADTGNDSRDKKMHREVLRSGEHPTATLRVDGFEGDLAPSGASRITVRGELVLLGQAHPVAIPADVTLDGDRVKVSGSFEIPYVAWGLEDPSSFILRVDKTVQVEVEAACSVAEPTPSLAPVPTD